MTKDFSENPNQDERYWIKVGELLRACDREVD